MALTNAEIKHITASQKPLWVSDERGLRLLVKPTGAKYWRLKYRFKASRNPSPWGSIPKFR